MKKPLLFSLFVWLLLFVLPWTRGLAWLDWKSATLERLSGINPAWAPLDGAYQPEKDAMLAYTYNSPDELGSPKEDAVKDVQANSLQVAPQFSALTQSNDRDVLVWCARSPKDVKAVTRNLVALSRRFPSDADMLAWACGNQMQEMSLFTRIPGPLSSSSLNWSMQFPTPSSSTPSTSAFNVPENGPRVEYGLRPQWDALAIEARRGQKMEPNNGFWWWLEVTCLLGARRDEQIWSVLKTGCQKSVYDDHDQENTLSLRGAHLKTAGVVPLAFYLQNSGKSWKLYSSWRDATRQVCENIMGKRLQGEHKVALEGGRDMVFMGRTMRRSSISYVSQVGRAVEIVSMQNALPYSVALAPFVRMTSPVQVLANHPRSLLRYANEQNRKDIAQQLVGEWNTISQSQRKALAAAPKKPAGAASKIEGVSDELTALVAGLQNVGRMLVQTLPIPLLALAALSLLTRGTARRDEPFLLPTWTHGLGWSAFALLVLLGAQVLFNYLVWDFVTRNFGGPTFWGFDFSLARLVVLLPVWAFAFPACAAGVGALWGTMFAARRGLGDVSIWGRLKLLFSAPDNRVGVVNLEPLVQIIALMGIWGVGLFLLGSWFYLPQNKALETRLGETLHDQAAGLFLAVFVLIAVVPALYFRTGSTGFRAYSWSWVQVARRFLVAHIALATTLYLLLAIGNAFSVARFETQWLKANAPQSLASGEK